jgi:molybdenum cofactor biosynthesis enzyme MoaA
MLAKNKWTDSTTTFFVDLENALPDLTNIDMLGGETFLVKQFDKIIKLAVQGGHSKQIRLHYNSNGSIFPKQQVTMWRQFKQVDLAISIDNIGQRFEIERGGMWNEVENNIKQFLALGLPNLNVYIMPTVNIQNVFYIPELVDWARSLGLQIVFSYLDYPTAFNINYLTEECKQLVVKKYKKYTHPELVAIAKRVEESKGSDGSMFVAEVTRLDALRNQSFQKTHPEIAFAMGYRV